METVIDFIFWGSKVTADCDDSHEKRVSAPEIKAMANLDSILNSRDKGAQGQSHGFSSSHVWI